MVMSKMTNIVFQRQKEVGVLVRIMVVVTAEDIRQKIANIECTLLAIGYGCKIDI
jgi:hypothetical protein